ncbi:hypothetical protein B0I35DRAFT_404885 [Stachybotrys elegans]|uniref:Uncharacterized protein n=1 Tax=Stachybotrys elegans TaxID=80388 RepID=A0A8K0T3D9_9HYPO|nr:hypothetical protein B0I35DRAFT_404885 [Stachybotrys elegans]
MVYFIAATFALRTLGALAVAIPADQDAAYANALQTFNASKVSTSKDLFAAGKFYASDPALSVPKNESIFDVADEVLASLGPRSVARGRTKRHPLDRWEDVAVQRCYALGDTPTNPTLTTISPFYTRNPAYWLDFIVIIQPSHWAIPNYTHTTCQE